jgi:DNA polymerase III subunit beta
MTFKTRMTCDALAAAVPWPVRLVRGAPANPVLGGILLTADQTPNTEESAASGLTLTTFDYSVGAVSTAAAEVDTPGRVLVSGRLLAAVVKVLPDGMDVELAADDQFLRLTVHEDGTEFELPLMPAEDFPRLPAMPAPIGQVDATVWAAAVQRVTAAADPKADTWAAGVLITLDADSGLRLAATDRYRLAEAVAPWQPALHDGTTTRALLVPADVLLEASKALAATGDTTVTLTAGDGEHGRFGMLCGRQQMTTPVLALEFPTQLTHTILTAPHTHRAVVDVALLADAVDRVSVVAADDAHQITLTFTSNGCELTAGLRDRDGVSRTVIEAEFTGDDGFTIVFAAPLLRAAIGTMRADTAELLFTTPARPCLLRPVHTSGTEDGPAGYVHAVMPLKPPPSTADRARRAA